MAAVATEAAAAATVEWVAEAMAAAAVAVSALLLVDIWAAATAGVLALRVVESLRDAEAAPCGSAEMGSPLPVCGSERVFD